MDIEDDRIARINLFMHSTEKLSHIHEKSCGVHIASFQSMLGHFSTYMAGLK